MYKKTIKFTDYNGTEREEDFFFNLNESETIKWEYSYPGGFSAMMVRITQAQDIKEIIDVFEELIRQSYGEKSPDGREFVKSPKLVERFMQTEAYNKMFMELCSDSKAAADFFNNVLPESIRSEAAKEAAATPKLVPVE